MDLKKIRLDLARDHDYPYGSHERGYEFIAPLDDTWHIDGDAWAQNKDKCRVHRFWAGEADEYGHLVRKPGGNWAFHYDIHGDVDDDETGYRFAAHAFKQGEYVSIREHDDDVLRTFRVVSVLDFEE